MAEATAADRDPRPVSLASALKPWPITPEYGYMRRMADILPILVPVAVGAAALALLAGLVNMMRGGPGNRSQMLMRSRVILQFIAIVLIMATLFFATR